MFARVTTVAFEGIEARGVDVQVQIGPGLPAFTIVGLADKAVAESRERVRGALNAIGLALPPKRITVNLAPADLPKEGSHYDLPIALGLMAAVGAIARDAIENYCVLGELALDGSIAGVAGALPAAIGANALGKGLICPASCGAEAAWAAEDMSILAPSDLLVLVNHFKGLQTLRRPQPTPDLDDTAMPDLTRHQRTGDGEARARSRCRRRSQSADGRTTGRWQVDAGAAAAIAAAAARARGDAGSQHDPKPCRRSQRRQNRARAAVPQPASFGEHGGFGRRRHAAKARRGRACASRRAVSRRAAGVPPASARCVEAAARDRRDRDRARQSPHHLSVAHSARGGDESVPLRARGRARLRLPPGAAAASSATRPASRDRCSTASTFRSKCPPSRPPISCCRKPRKEAPR